jgi:hypothetical protein
MTAHKSYIAQGKPLEVGMVLQRRTNTQQLSKPIVYRQVTVHIPQDATYDEICMLYAGVEELRQAVWKRIQEYEPEWSAESK